MVEWIDDGVIQRINDCFVWSKTAEVVRSRIYTIMGEELKKSALDEQNNSYPGDGNSVS
jgi:hypothetical protein